MHHLSFILSLVNLIINSRHCLFSFAYNMIIDSFLISFDGISTGVLSMESESLNHYNKAALVRGY